MKKVILALALVLVIVAASVSLVACSGDSDQADLTVGAIMVGDETEGYTEAHMNGINAAIASIKEKTGKTVNVIWKKKVAEDATCATACEEAIAAGAQLVITNSYSHQFQIGDVITANPDVTFVSMTGDLAAGSGKSNWKNAFTKVYESRYVSGVVAGMKLQELVNNNRLTAANYDGANIKIGYVGAFDYAEVVSGYTAFYLGIKSIVPNIVMKVQYTNSWFDFNAENETAKALIADGCVIIGQHADSEGAPTAVEDANKKGTVVYSVGYNVSMLKAAPTAALTSASNNWAVYYEYLFTQALEGKEIAVDWAKGYEANAVEITALGTSCAAGTQAKVEETIAKIKNGQLKVFDCSTFTVTDPDHDLDHDNLTTYTWAYGMGTAECIAHEGDVYYFNESALRSAPYFDVRIDGISESGAQH